MPSTWASIDAAPSPRELLRDLVSLTKPRLSSLVLFTAGIGLLLAPESIGWDRATATIASLVLLVGAANTLNNYLERESDAFMARTAARPLPTGRLPPAVALIQGLLLAAIALPILWVAANPLTAGLGVLALVTYVLIYTPLKRRTALATIVGAVPGALPPLMGWTAASGRLDAGGLLLFTVLFLWQMPHFLAIGLYRSEEYASAGLVVSANSSGARATRWQIAGYLVALLPVSLLLVVVGVGGWLTGVAALGLGMGFLWKGLQGLRAGADARWARGLFLYSLVYLSGLFTVLAVDRLLR